MNTMLNTLVALLADGDAGAPAGGPPGGGGGNFLNVFTIQIFVIFGAFWYFFVHLPSKRERARQAAMWAGMKKNDRVLTTSGILGVVTNVNKESNPPEVTLRIDETSNAKLRVLLSSVAQVLGDEPSADTPSK